MIILESSLKAWFPYRCICRVCRTKKIHRTDTTLWKPPVQMLNTTETSDTTCCTRKNEFYLSYEFFSFDRHDRYNDMETRLKFKATVSCPSMQKISHARDSACFYFALVTMFSPRFFVCFTSVFQIVS